MDITVVACPGPPPVRAWMVVKFCRDVITELIIKKNVVGEIIGITIFLILCHLLAPSI